MPEHREGTPEALVSLESFLWWDFDPQTWKGWVEERGFDPGSATSGFAEAMVVQDALRRLQSANNGGPLDADAVERVNHALARHAVRPRLSSNADLDFVPMDAGSPIGSVLRSLVEAMISGAWRRFKLCRDLKCRASYFDASKNNSKTWCSMETCGSRNKMRRHRARRG
jgi:predicted RNA-binding Zn ribbon-like protein